MEKVCKFRKFEIAKGVQSDVKGGDNYVGCPGEKWCLIPPKYVCPYDLPYPGCGERGGNGGVLF